MLLYADDFLIVSGRPREALQEVNNYFPMKATSIVPTKIYLGAKVGRVQLPNGVEAYTIIMSQYVQEAVNNVDKYLYDRGLALLKKALTPMLTNYSPVFEGSSELNEQEAAFYQSLIEILWWMVEMVRLVIFIEVSAISYFVWMPRQGHFQQLLHLFAYLNIHFNDWIVFDSS